MGGPIQFEHTLSAWNTLVIVFPGRSSHPQFVYQIQIGKSQVLSQLTATRRSYATLRCGLNPLYTTKWSFYLKLEGSFGNVEAALPSFVHYEPSGEWVIFRTLNIFLSLCVNIWVRLRPLEGTWNYICVHPLSSNQFRGNSIWGEWSSSHSHCLSLGTSSRDLLDFY